MGLPFWCVLFLSVNAFIVVISSPLKESDEILDSLGSPEVLIDVHDKRFDSFANGFGQSKRSFDEINRSQFGFNKRRNFDEIGRSQFGFNKRRNFDEIGRSSFGFNKRRDFDEIGRSSFGFAKRGDFDEIGRSSFGFYRRSPQPPRNLSRWRFFSNFGKRDGPWVDIDTDKKSFDEINRSNFGFNRRDGQK